LSQILDIGFFRLAFKDMQRLAGLHRPKRIREMHPLKRQTGASGFVRKK
jgi:hypothetical protein